MASRHFCWAVATAPPEPVVVGDAVAVVVGDAGAVVVGDAGVVVVGDAGALVGEEAVLEVPHALSAITALTSTTSGEVR